MLILFLLFEVCLCFILKKAIGHHPKFEQYLGEQKDSVAIENVNDLLSFTILFNFIVPISLYVTIGKNHQYVINTPKEFQLVLYLP